MADLIKQLLESTALSDVTQIAQIIVLVYMLRLLTRVETQTKETRDWHNQPDPEHPGAMIWWGLGISDVARELHSLVKEMKELLSFVKENLPEKR